MMDNTERTRSPGSDPDPDRTHVTPPASATREETGFERTLQRESDRSARLRGAKPLDEAPPTIPDVRIDSLLGRGGQGVVYRAHQTYLERDVAVKVLMSGADADFEQRFRREARILAGLQDPHIVACHQAGVTEDGRCYLVMEFIDGPDLARRIDEHGKLALRDALTLTRDVALALAHAQSVGIIHRDVKPQNVLLAPHAAAGASFPFRAKLADLGLARGGAGELALTQLTAPGAIMGTPSTMAPEQFDDAAQVDFRADIYGLGCVLYHSLAGQCAYSGQTLGQVIRRKSSGAPPDLTRVNPGVPPAVARLVQRMLAADRERRPASYAELIAELEAHLAHVDRPPLRARAAPAARPAFVVALLAALAAAWWGSREAVDESKLAPELAQQDALEQPNAVAPPTIEGVGANAAPSGAVVGDTGTSDAVGEEVESSAPTTPEVAPSSLPPGARWRPFEAWNSLEELLQVDGWRRDEPPGRNVWGCFEGDLSTLLANSPTGLSTASRELPRGAWTLRGELSARSSFGWDAQESRAGVRLVLADSRALEWECSTAQAPQLLRWRLARLDGERWRLDESQPGGARLLAGADARFECSFEAGTLALSLVERDQVHSLVALSAQVRALELFVEGGMGQWTAFEFVFR
jgi:hypothetical protein